MPSAVPRISILLPAWNAADTLGACLTSIVRQSETSWECIIVDDGSTDRTRAVACEAVRHDPRFRLVAIPHRGLVAALNEGLAGCRASLVARMDADDLMHTERLARQAAVLDGNRGLSAAGCHVRIFPRRSMAPRLREYEQWLNGLSSEDDVRRDLFVECPLAHPSLMMRREMAALGYVDSGWPEDYDLVLRAHAAGLRVGIVSIRLLMWRDRPNGLSRTDHRYSLDAFTACKAHFLARGFLATSERYILWGYGGTGKALRAALAARGRSPSHIVEVKPTRLGQRIHAALVIPPEDLPSIGRQPIIVSVARGGPRAEIRRALAAMGFIEMKDYVCAA
jgi:glycosyltransferase involved in cell wall biosynthesis